GPSRGDEGGGRNDAARQARSPKLVAQGERRSEQVEQGQPDAADFRIPGGEPIPEAARAFHVRDSVPVKIGKAAGIEEVKRRERRREDDGESHGGRLRRQRKRFARAAPRPGRGTSSRLAPAGRAPG